MFKRRLAICTVLVFTLCGSPLFAQLEGSISGFVTDQTTGETLILANVVLLPADGSETERTLGAATNNSGYFTITNIAAGSYRLIASYIGYTNYQEELTVVGGENLRLDIAMTPESVQVDEVLVTAEREIEEELRKIGVAQISTDIVKRAPALLEPDVFRSLQLLPGVKAASDYSSGLYIRGGSPDQTLILLDRTTVYNPSHFFGFFSTFNPDAVKDVRLYKGAYPAEYGGRLGSVVDIYNKDGNRKETRGMLSLGLLASRTMVEGPYNKGSWMLAVRRSTLEPLLAAFQSVDGIPESFYFVDVNAKVNFDISPNDRVSASVYAGQDKLKLPIIDDSNIRIRYGNRTLSTNWTHIFSEKLFSNFNLTASRYFSEPKFIIASTEFTRDNNVWDISAKGDLEYVVNEKHAFSAGFWTGNFTFRLQDSFDGQPTLTERTQSLYTSVYLQDEYSPSPQWVVKAGARANYFEEGKYLRLEPRMSIENKSIRAVRLQAGYGRYYQFLTLITSELFSGSDIWLTTDTGVPPAYGDQFVIGAKANLTSEYRLDTEVYYRTMKDLFELDPFIVDAAGLEYADLFHFGEGYAYGSEILLDKSKGKLNGFAGYTFGVTRRKFDGFEGEKYFSPKYDRTHDINVVANYDFSKKWRVTGVFNYATGQAYSEPTRQFKLLDNPFGSTVGNVLQGSFNASRLPAYHRLDVGVSKLGNFFRLGSYELQLQVLNAYNRRNVWFYFLEFEDDNTVKRNTIPQIPIPLPNVSLTLRF